MVSGSSYPAVAAAEVYVRQLRGGDSLPSQRVAVAVTSAYAPKMPSMTRATTATRPTYWLHKIVIAE